MNHPPREHGRRGPEAFVREWLELTGARLGLGIAAEVSARRDNVAVVLKADGRGFGHRRAVQVASALQTLLEVALAREGFREGLELSWAEVTGAGAATEQGLLAAVRATAAAAVQRGRAFAVGPMSVADRRQVHQALSELREVWTQSEGEGIFRRLWVVPRALMEARAAAPPPPPPAGEMPSTG